MPCPCRSDKEPDHHAVLAAVHLSEVSVHSNRRHFLCQVRVHAAHSTDSKLLHSPLSRPSEPSNPTPLSLPLLPFLVPSPSLSPSLSFPCHFIIQVLLGFFSSFCFLQTFSDISYSVACCTENEVRRYGKYRYRNILYIYAHDANGERGVLMCQCVCSLREVSGGHIGDSQQMARSRDTL